MAEAYIRQKITEVRYGNCDGMLWRRRSDQYIWNKPALWPSNNVQRNGNGRLNGTVVIILMILFLYGRARRAPINTRRTRFT